jgi:UDP-2,3-diacylglucosamine pyrophosphatase LpxH
MELIVISDLHLSAGYNEETGRYSRNEDFFFDEEFKRFLEYLQGANPGNNHLIIAGDLFDFLQVNARRAKELSKTRGTPFEITKRELTFGLGTEEEKTVWKLRVIVNGHKVFFQALATFLSKKNFLSIITGNHDIELYWPKVQNALVGHIVDNFEPGQGIRQRIKKRISFFPWFYYDKDYKAYIEHGNQYDSLNSFHYLLYPVFGRDSKRLWLPFGSFFVRYFFNKLEISNPFADNIKPPTRYMKWAWKEDKLQFLQNIYHYLPTMIRVFLKGGKLRKAEKEHLTEGNNRELKKLSQVLGLPLNAVRNIYSLMAPPLTTNKLLIIFAFAGTFFLIIALIVFIVLFALSQYFHFSPWTSLSSLGLLIVPIAKWAWSKWFQKDPLDIILPKIKAYLKDVKIIVFGHTHDPDIRRVDKEGRYFNTATWTTVFSDEERIIREAKQFAFVWIKEIDGKPKARLLRWNNSLREADKLILFERKPHEASEARRRT